MSRKRRRREPAWVRGVAFVAAIATAALLAALLLRGMLGALGLRQSRSAGGGDPQFAEPAESVTRPPELDETGSPIAEGDDPSKGWELGEQTPVDKTAGELAREAEASR